MLKGLDAKSGDVLVVNGTSPRVLSSRLLMSSDGTQIGQSGATVSDQDDAKGYILTESAGRVHSDRYRDIR
jgi:hypothetical protein